jgi:hypothetical protein
VQFAVVRCGRKPFELTQRTLDRGQVWGHGPALVNCSRRSDDEQYVTDKVRETDSTDSHDADAADAQ